MLINDQYWQEKWQQNEIGFNQSTPNILLQKYLPQFNLAVDAKILVPLCGKSIDMIWLSKQGYQVIGIELSPVACRAFFHEHNLLMTTTHQDGFIIFKNLEKNITLFCGDFFSINKNIIGSIDTIYDRAALIALPEKIRSKYVNYLVSLSDIHTKILLITTAYDQEQMNGPPFSVDENTVRSLYESHFSVHQCYNKPLKSIPNHLQSKGLRAANEQAYILEHY
jgi:thiopurine S-methyltransferase